MPFCEFCGKELIDIGKGYFWCEAEKTVFTTFDGLVISPRRMRTHEPVIYDFMSGANVKDSENTK